MRVPDQHIGLNVRAEILLADGLEGALIGLGRRCSQPDIAVYSIPLAMAVLVTRDGMREEEAREYLEFNSIGAWVGPATPIWVEAMTLDEIHAYADADADAAPARSAPPDDV